MTPTRGMPGRTPADGSLMGLVEVADQLGDRRLARSIGANEGDDLTWRDREADTAQCRRRRSRVGEPYVVEDDRFVGRIGTLGVRLRVFSRLAPGPDQKLRVVLEEEGGLLDGADRPC